MKLSTWPRTAAWLALSCGALACVTEQEGVAVKGVRAELRGLHAEEALADFDVLTESFRANYGPLERKEQRYSFSFDEHVRQSRRALKHADSGIERERVFASFIARFHDIHVSLSGALPTDESPGYWLPFWVQPVEDTYVVYEVEPLLLPEGAPAPARGEELLAVDGVPAAEIVERFAPLFGAPNPLTEKHVLAASLTVREAIFADGISAGDEVVLTLRNAEGVVRDVTLSWQPLPSGLAEPQATEATAARSVEAARRYSSVAAKVIATELNQLGNAWPFYLTEQVQESFEVTPVLPSDRALADFGVLERAGLASEYFAAKYVYQGKRVLLLRLSSFDAAGLVDEADRMNYLRALLSEQQESSDVLVLDVTHNPGGSPHILQTLASMFATEPVNGIVEQLHADRLQIGELLWNASQLRGQLNPSEADLALADELDAQARALDALLDSGEPLSEPFAVALLPKQSAPDRVRWSKPLLVLVDELSVSAADFFPLLVKANQLAPLFGQRTAGGGGHVSNVATLPHSGLYLDITRGLGTVFDPTGAYPEDRYVEDNGVAPDIEYSHTLADFRAGYVGYVEAFSKAAAAL